MISGAYKPVEGRVRNIRPAGRTIPDSAAKPGAGVSEQPPAAQAGKSAQQSSSPPPVETAANRGLLGQVEDAFAQPLSFEGLAGGSLGDLNATHPLAGPSDFGQQRSWVESSVFDRAMGLLQPQLDREEQRVRTDLVNRGLPDTSEAYRDLYGDFSTQRDRALNDLSLASVLAGSQEHDRLSRLAANNRGALFQQNLTARQQDLSERRLARAQPVNDLVSLLAGTTSIPKFPGYTNYAIQAPDYQGLVGSNYAAAANAHAAQSGGLMGGIGSAISGLFSDRELKRDMRIVGKTDNGLNVYVYRYKYGQAWHMGLMADEVEKVRPEAVGEVHGYKVVDYGRAV